MTLASDRIRILAIGNSFSDDAMSYLPDILLECGVREVLIGNLVIGGCSLQTHWDNAQHNKALYNYYKNIQGTWQAHPEKTLRHGLEDAQWDLVTLQQVSSQSGKPETYNTDLTNLIAYVREACPQARLAWHMTWSYAPGSTHGAFGAYDQDSEKMYRAIVQAVQTKILPNRIFSLLIPAGTAIQNGRRSLGEDLTRDGYHLNKAGRFLVGLTWARSLGLPIDNVKTLPEEVPPAYLPKLKQAAEQAVASPFRPS